MNNFKIDFIGIGAKKAATTWIFECLKEHPEICASNKKETCFFSRGYHKGINFYKQYFKHCGNNKIIGEYSNEYLSDEKSATRIKKHFPNVKIIVCLRNPVDRFISHYLFNKSRKENIRNKTNYLAKKMKDEWQNEKKLLNEGLYYKHLKKYFDLFPAKNIKILLYEDIKKNPQKFIQSLFEFLEVKKNFIPKNLKIKINATTNKGRKFFFLLKIFQFGKYLANKNNFLKIFFKKIKIDKLAQIINKWNLNEKSKNYIDKKIIDKMTRNKIKNFYYNDNKKLKKYLKNYYNKLNII